MSDDDDESVFIAHEPCPACGSQDNLGRYSDGHAHCFGCGHYEPADGRTYPRGKRNRMTADLLDEGRYGRLAARRITEDTCRKFGYQIGRYKGEPVQIANYRSEDGGEIVAQHIRDGEKNMPWIGDKKEAQPLWGMHLYNKGKRVVITEGEIDAMTLSQVQGNKWPVVSISSGAQGAHKDISRALEWLKGFDEVVLWFDADEAGRAAADKCVGLFRPGHVKIAAAPEGYKDASDIMQAGRDELMMPAIWEAKTWRPDSVKKLSAFKDAIFAPVEWGLPYWDDRITQVTYGRRYGEAVAIGAGTGVGKTDWITQQISFDVNVLKEKVGLFMFEQQPAETGKRLAGKMAGKRFHIPDGDWTEDQLRSAVDDLIKNDLVYVYDHFGQTDWDRVRESIRFLAKVEGVRLFYIDHLTAFAAGNAGDVSARIEEIMTEIGGLVKELDIWLLFVSHLNTPDGRPHEEGGRVMIRHFKGSRAIGFWSHFMFGMERDQQAEDDAEKHTTTFRVLKDRYTGMATGRVFLLGYDHDEGALTQLDEKPAMFSDQTGAAPDDF